MSQEPESTGLCYLHVTLRAKPERVGEISQRVEDVRKAAARVGIHLVGCYQSASQPTTFILLWAVPDRALIERFQSEAGEAGKALDECIEGEQVELLQNTARPAPRAADERGIEGEQSAPDAESGSADDSLLIVSDDGGIYRLVKERWQDPAFKVEGRLATWLNDSFIHQGVVMAHLPPCDPLKPFFFCYLLNLGMIKAPPKKDDQ